MDLKKARSQAQHLADFRMIDHVVIKCGTEYAVCAAKHYSGKPIETFKYENKTVGKESAKLAKAKSESKQVSDISYLRDAPDKKVL